jgi:hypothetical protein
MDTAVLNGFPSNPIEAGSLFFYYKKKRVLPLLIFFQRAWQVAAF